MAPEQLEGQAVDARTDVFAFGTTLYEMLTARRAFDGASQASITAAILTSDPPPVSSLPPSGPANVPPALDHVISRALAKDPSDRWQSMHDVIVELEWIKDGRSTPPAAAPLRFPWRWAAGIVLGAVTLLAIGSAIGRRWQSPGEHVTASEPVAFEIDAPEGTSFDPGYGIVAVSPNGRRMVFKAIPRGSERPSLYVRDLAVPNARRLYGTEGAANQFWSPDGQFIGYLNERQQVVRLNVDDGSEQVICDPPAEGGPAGLVTGAWFDDGTILVTDNARLFRCKADLQGPMAKLLDKGAGAFPSALPGGRYLVVHLGGAVDVPGNAARTIDGRNISLLPAVKSNAAYISGHLVFRDGDQLVAQAFDEKTLQLTGSRVQLAPTVQYNPGNQRTTFSVGGDALVYRVAVPNRLVWKNRSGEPLGSFVGEPGHAFNPAIAPDDSGRVAFDRYNPSSPRFNVVIASARGDVLSSEGQGDLERFPVWSPDGLWLVRFVGGAGENSKTALVRTRPDGSNPEELLPGARPLAWSPDNKYIIYSPAPGRSQGIWALAVPKPGIPHQDPFSVVEFPGFSSSVSTSASFSPDGQWIAYSQGPQNDGVWVQRFPSGEKKQAVTPSGANPTWGRDSKELFFEKRDGTIMSVPVTFEPALTFGQSRELFRNRAGNISLYPHPYAVSKDSQRFLVNELPDVPDRFTVVLHWTALLR
jgi:Tol biopolymer transport system component